MLRSGGVGSFGPSRLTVKLSRQQPAPGGGLQTQAEALPEFWGVERQQHQADSSGVVSLQDRGLPGDTLQKRALHSRRFQLLLHPDSQAADSRPPQSQSEVILRLLTSTQSVLFMLNRHLYVACGLEFSLFVPDPVDFSRHLHINAPRVLLIRLCEVNADCSVYWLPCNLACTLRFGLHLGTSPPI